jgi:UDP:flavonoid glycosyltransferase YjiC (YdhE family)
VLISYGGFAFDRLDPAALAAVPHVTFVTTTTLRGTVPENVVALPLESSAYHDVLAACDAVMMKPGYGTTADCLANRVPMIYTSRPGFAEETVLVTAMEQLGRAVPLPPEDLDAGRLGPAIAAALTSEKPWADIPLDGGTVIAQRIIAISGLATRDDSACATAPA